MIIDFSEAPGEGIPFRSRLEREIAAELDEHGVEWGYEQPVILPDGHSPRYLPDFTIHQANPDLKLPQWVEGKPQQFIYDLRDSLGVTRRSGERLQGEVEVRGRDHEWLKLSMIEELWKPKMLAEITGESVLVVGGVGGTSKLTVEMRHDCMVFSREHPFVNWMAHVRRLEREAQQEVWRREAEERDQQRRYNAEMQRLQAERQKADTLKSVLAYPSRGHNRHAGPCVGCGGVVAANMGSLYRVGIVGGGERWFVVCDTCRRSS